jgi:hypothetical protein
MFQFCFAGEGNTKTSMSDATIAAALTINRANIVVIMMNLIGDTI